MTMRVPRAVSKYEGLLRLEAYCLPHPDWLFARTCSDIPSRPWTMASHGWTVRICTTDGYVTGLPCAHRLQFEQVHQALVNLPFSAYRGEVFVIYPSWRFLYAGTCDLTVDQLYIEAVAGDISPLLRGSRSPDVRYSFAGPYYRELAVGHDPGNVMPASTVGEIAALVRRITVRKEVLIEWTKTSENALLFHDWLEVE